mgnify:CR=1 FL=1
MTTKGGLESFLAGPSETKIPAPFSQTEGDDPRGDYSLDWWRNSSSVRYLRRKQSVTGEPQSYPSM